MICSCHPPPGVESLEGTYTDPYPVSKSYHLTFHHMKMEDDSIQQLLASPHLQKSGRFCHNDLNYTHKVAYSSYIVFPGLFFILFSHFFSFMVVKGLGLGSMGVGLGLGFSVDWVWDLWCGALWVFLGMGLSKQA